MGNTCCTASSERTSPATQSDDRELNSATGSDRSQPNPFTSPSTQHEEHGTAIAPLPLDQGFDNAVIDGDGDTKPRRHRRRTRGDSAVARSRRAKSVTKTPSASSHSDSGSSQSSVDSVTVRSSKPMPIAVPVGPSAKVDANTGGLPTVKRRNRGGRSKKNNKSATSQSKSLSRSGSHSFSSGDDSDRSVSQEEEHGMLPHIRLRHHRNNPTSTSAKNLHGSTVNQKEKQQDHHLKKVKSAPMMDHQSSSRNSQQKGSVVPPSHAKTMSRHSSAKLNATGPGLVDKEERGRKKSRRKAKNYQALAGEGFGDPLEFDNPALYSEESNTTVESGNPSDSESDVGDTGPYLANRASVVGGSHTRQPRRRSHVVGDLFSDAIALVDYTREIMNDLGIPTPQAHQQQPQAHQHTTHRDLESSGFMSLSSQGALPDASVSSAQFSALRSNVLPQPSAIAMDQPASSAVVEQAAKYFGTTNLALALPVSMSAQNPQQEELIEVTKSLSALGKMRASRDSNNHPTATSESSSHEVSAGRPQVSASSEKSSVKEVASASVEEPPSVQLMSTRHIPPMQREAALDQSSSLWSEDSPVSNNRRVSVYSIISASLPSRDAFSTYSKMASSLASTQLSSAQSNQTANTAVTPTNRNSHTTSSSSGDTHGRGAKLPRPTVVRASSSTTASSGDKSMSSIALHLITSGLAGAIQQAELSSIQQQLLAHVRRAFLVLRHCDPTDHQSHTTTATKRFLQSHGIEPEQRVLIHDAEQLDDILDTAQMLLYDCFIELFCSSTEESRTVIVQNPVVGGGPPQRRDSTPHIPITNPAALPNSAADDPSCAPPKPLPSSVVDSVERLEEAVADVDIGHSTFAPLDSSSHTQKELNKKLVELLPGLHVTLQPQQTAVPTPDYSVASATSVCPKLLALSGATLVVCSMDQFEATKSAATHHPSTTFSAFTNCHDTLQCQLHGVSTNIEIGGKDTDHSQLAVVEVESSQQKRCVLLVGLDTTSCFEDLTPTLNGLLHELYAVHRQRTLVYVEQCCATTGPSTKKTGSQTVMLAGLSSFMICHMQAALLHGFRAPLPLPHPAVSTNHCSGMQSIISMSTFVGKMVELHMRCIEHFKDNKAPKPQQQGHGTIENSASNIPVDAPPPPSSEERKPLSVQHGTGVQHHPEEHIIAHQSLFPTRQHNASVRNKGGEPGLGTSPFPAKSNESIASTVSAFSVATTKQSSTSATGCHNGGAGAPMVAERANMVPFTAAFMNLMIQPLVMGALRDSATLQATSTSVSSPLLASVVEPLGAKTLRNPFPLSASSNGSLIPTTFNHPTLTTESVVFLLTTHAPWITAFLCAASSGGDQSTQ